MLNTNCLHTATAIIAEDKVTDFFRIANDLCKVFCIYCNHIKLTPRTRNLRIVSLL